jgi:protein phosphatase
MGGSDRAIRLRSSARTSTGQVRENNEDSVRVWADDDFVVAVVADGMGGAAAGEEASRLAVEAIQDEIFLANVQTNELLQTTTDDVIVQKLCDSIRSANLNIVRRAAAQPELRGMGTTMTLAFVRSTSAIVAHVGDSRAYLVDGRSRRITQITADHSFVQALVAAGHLTPEEAEHHPMSSVLYRALGQHEDVDVDIYEAHLRLGDRLVLCSDGLTRHVKAPEIARIVADGLDPDHIAERLIELANARGGEDNVTVVVVALDPIAPERTTQELTKFIDPDDTETLLLSDIQIARSQGGAIAAQEAEADNSITLQSCLDAKTSYVTPQLTREGRDTLAGDR